MRLIPSRSSVSPFPLSFLPPRFHATLMECFLLLEWLRMVTDCPFFYICSALFSLPPPLNMQSNSPSIRLLNRLPSPFLSMCITHMRPPLSRSFLCEMPCSDFGDGVVARIPRSVVTVAFCSFGVDVLIHIRVNMHEWTCVLSWVLSSRPDQPAVLLYAATHLLVRSVHVGLKPRNCNAAMDNFGG